MLPAGQKRQNESLDQNVDSDDSEEKPVKRNGRRKIKIEYIEDKNRRHITFSKRKAGIMKKAYELSTLTGTQVLLLVVSETGLVYTFTTTKLQPIVTKPEGKNLIQACLNTPEQSIPNQINSENKLEDGGGYMPRPSNDTASNASPVPAVNRISDEASQNQLSPQTTSSHSPLMQPSANVMRQQQQSMVGPPMAASNINLNISNSQQQQTSGAIHYSSGQQPPQQSHHTSQPPQIGGIPPYNQQRYPPHQGYSANLPQPNQPYHHPSSHHNQPQQAQYGGPQQPYYQQSPQQQPPQQHQNSSSAVPPPMGYWSFNDQQQGNAGNTSSSQQQQARQTIKPKNSQYEQLK
ncbi:hypothetical protein [Parasitella parasitica]|uniref:MADS-box domain-containing protein n=1 Tax=Parasitella parasitica TaxID=35722 RepID=A0A0B7MYY7_9FUNG|nr:hypothetical protein [Parasitella parasitica]